jgi:hypothetical protein
MRVFVNGIERDATPEERAELEATQAGLSAIAKEAVKAEAGRRITAAYPITRQLNIMRGSDADALAEMSAFIDAIRAKSDEIEAMDPIPTDFADDRHWG